MPQCNCYILTMVCLTIENGNSFFFEKNPDFLIVETCLPLSIYGLNKLLMNQIKWFYMAPKYCDRFIVVVLLVCQ